MVVKTVLYLSYTGISEPLGQSQVLSYLCRLSADHAITLITCEKPEDWTESNKMGALEKVCADHRIRWFPLKYYSYPRYLAPMFSIARMLWLGGREIHMGRIQLIHARSYIPAVAAFLLSKVYGVPFIFDMRALWPEELIAAGRLKRKSLLHKIIVIAERKLLFHAAAVVSLTDAAVKYLIMNYPRQLKAEKFAVIPTCADLNRFSPLEASASQCEAKTIGCLGTVLSGWFRVDMLASFFQLACEKDSGLTFEVTTRDDPLLVREALGGDFDFQSRIRVAPASPEQVPKALQSQIATVMFFTGGLSKVGSCPTRMAEALACGIPVVTNEGVGDAADIIRNYRVGVIVSGSSAEAMTLAWEELNDLLKEPDLAGRCRDVAEEVFSLEMGAAKYAKLYEGIIR